MPVYEEQTVSGGSSMTMMLTFLIAVLIITVVPAVVLLATLHIFQRDEWLRWGSQMDSRHCGIRCAP